MIKRVSTMGTSKANQKRKIEQYALNGMKLLWYYMLLGYEALKLFT